MGEDWWVKQVVKLFACQFPQVLLHQFVFFSLWVFVCFEAYKTYKALKLGLFAEAVFENANLLQFKICQP